MLSGRRRRTWSCQFGFTRHVADYSFEPLVLSPRTSSLVFSAEMAKVARSLRSVLHRASMRAHAVTKSIFQMALRGWLPCDYAWCPSSPSTSHISEFRDLCRSLARSLDDTGKRCFSNWKFQDCLLAAGQDLTRALEGFSYGDTRHPLRHLRCAELLRTGRTDGS